MLLIFCYFRVIIRRYTYIPEAKTLIISFFGHADFQKTAHYEQTFLSLLESSIGNLKVSFYLGNHGKFDTFAYHCCKKYQAKHLNAELIFITPYLASEYQQKTLKDQSKIYDGIIYPEIENKPLKFAIYYRNRWMVEHSDLIICGISHDWGGAYQTCLYAKRCGKPVLNVIDKALP